MSDILTTSHLLLLIATLSGIYMAWNIGANDVANAIGTSVGSGAIRLRSAVILAAIFEFCGSYFFGHDVSQTMSYGIIDISLFKAEPLQLAIGMISALLATGIWLQIASYYCLPVSTTHSIVGALAGFGFYSYGLEALHLRELQNIALSWIISPLAGGLIAYLAFTLLRRAIFFKPRPLVAARRLAPLIISIFTSVMCALTLFNLTGKEQFKVLRLEIVLILLCLSAISYIATQMALPLMIPDEGELVETDAENEAAAQKIDSSIANLLQIRGHISEDMKSQLNSRIKELEIMREQLPLSSCALKNPQIQKVEKFFAYMQACSACFMALSHGANDVSNAVGPLSVAISILYEGIVPIVSPIQSWTLALGGFGIVVGLATWGWRVVETVGKKITQLTPSRGVVAEFGCASTVLVCSQLGLPVSTTHVLVGSIMGVGLARGIGSLSLSTLRDIVISWLITVPTGALICMALSFCLGSILY